MSAFSSLAKYRSVQADTISQLSPSLRSCCECICRDCQTNTPTANSTKLVHTVAAPKIANSCRFPSTSLAFVAKLRNSPTWQGRQDSEDGSLVCFIEVFLNSRYTGNAARDIVDSRSSIARASFISAEVVSTCCGRKISEF